MEGSSYIKARDSEKLLSPSRNCSRGEQMFDQVEKGSGSSSSTAASNSDEDDRKTLLDEREQVRRLRTRWTIESNSVVQQNLIGYLTANLIKAKPKGRKRI